MRELTFSEVWQFWAESIIGVPKMPKGFTKAAKASDFKFDVKGTRLLCKHVLESQPDYTEDLKPLLVRFYDKGLSDPDDLLRVVEFRDNLAVSLIEKPVYPVITENLPTVEPTEYSQTELAEELGFAFAKGAQKWMVAHGYRVPGVSQCGSKWYMTSEAFRALKLFRKNFTEKEQNAA